MSVSGKVLRKGGNPNNVKDWEVCNGNPECPRHVHVVKNVDSQAKDFDDLVYGSKGKINDFLTRNPVPLKEKNSAENGVTVATLFSGATVALASGGGAVYIANAFAGGPVPFELAFGLAFVVGVMGGFIGGLAAYFNSERVLRNRKADVLIRKFEEENDTVLSKDEVKFFRQQTVLDLTDADHKQNFVNSQAEQDEANRKWLAEYNSAADKGSK